MPRSNYTNLVNPDNLEAVFITGKSEVYEHRKALDFSRDQVFVVRCDDLDTVRELFRLSAACARSIKARAHRKEIPFSVRRELAWGRASHLAIPKQVRAWLTAADPLAPNAPRAVRRLEAPPIPSARLLRFSATLRAVEMCKNTGAPYFLRHTLPDRMMAHEDRWEVLSPCRRYSIRKDLEPLAIAEARFKGTRAKLGLYDTVSFSEGVELVRELLNFPAPSSVRIGLWFVLSPRAVNGGGRRLFSTQGQNNND